MKQSFILFVFACLFSTATAQAQVVAQENQINFDAGLPNFWYVQTSVDHTGHIGHIIVRDPEGFLRIDVYDDYNSERIVVRSYCKAKNERLSRNTTIRTVVFNVGKPFGIVRECDGQLRRVDSKWLGFILQEANPAPMHIDALLMETIAGGALN